MRRLAIERKAIRQASSELSQPFERPLSLAVPVHLELACAGDPNLDLVAFL
jgi:hypothetical protein